MEDILKSTPPPLRLSAALEMLEYKALKIVRALQAAALKRVKCSIAHCKTHLG